MLSNKTNWFSTISTSLLYFFILTFPFINYSNSFLYFGTSTRSTNLIVVVSILTILLGFSLFKKTVKLSFPKSPILLLVSLYFLSIVISAIFSDDFYTSLYSKITRTTGLWYMTCLGILLFLLIDIFKNETKRRLFIICTVSSTAAFSFLSMLGPEGFGLFFKDFKGDGFTLGNSTFAGMYLFGGFILSLYFVFSENKKSWWKFILPTVIFINPYVINFGSSESRGSLSFIGEARASAIVFVSSMLSLIVFLFVSKIKSQDIKKKISYGFFLCFILIMFWGAFSLFSSDGVLRKFYLSQSTEARLLVWEISDKLIKEKPILGWGTDNFERVFELNYDSRILENENTSESWFDRAHNFFIDQAFDNGILGLILYVSIYIGTILSMLYVIFNSKKQNSKKLAVFIIIYIAFHLVELQTAFDTSISYLMLVIMLALSIVIFQETLEDCNNKSGYEVNNTIKYISAVVLICFGIWSLFFKALPFINSQITNGKMRSVGNSEKRIKLYPHLFNTPVDLRAILWRTSTDFQKGIAENPKILEDAAKVNLIKKELGIFESQYENYIKENKNDFRALLSYANVKIYFMLFGVNKLEEAQKILDQAMALVTTAPQPYWMKAVAYLYIGEFNLAREWAQKGLNLNPEVKTSQELVKYIDESIKTFPEIDLYFFKQI